jgi:hypothetical protein
VHFQIVKIYVNSKSTSELPNPFIHTCLHAYDSNRNLEGKMSSWARDQPGGTSQNRRTFRFLPAGRPKLYCDIQELSNMVILTSIDAPLTWSRRSWSTGRMKASVSSSVQYPIVSCVLRHSVYRLSKKRCTFD